MKSVQPPHSLLALFLLLFTLNSFAADTFYQRYLNLLGTNELWNARIATPSVTDTNKPAVITNTVIRLDALRTNGQLGNIHLGMTTDEVVTRWGLPQSLRCSWQSNPMLWYGNFRLVFHTNILDHVHIPPTARFEHNLRGDSPLQDWLRILGEPTTRTNTLSGGTSVTYQTRGPKRGVLTLTFDDTGQMGLPPDLRLAPQPLKP